MFIHLHTHSYYSLLDGLCSPSELVQAAVGQQMDSLALTDHASLTGAIEFYDLCRAAGIRPIMGLEIRVAAPLDLPAVSGSQAGNFVLLAADLDGWSNMCRLSSALLTGPSLEPARGLPFHLLASHSTGIICLTGGRYGLASQLAANERRESLSESAAAHFLGYLNEIFPDRLYIELQRQLPEDRLWADRLARLANRLHLPIVATQDIHYIKPEQQDLQRLVSAIRLNRPVKSIFPAKYSSENGCAPPGSYFASPAEISERFSDYPEAIAAAAEVSSRCNLDLPLGVPHYPQVELPPGVTPLQALKEKAESGAIRLYGQITAELRTRLDRELSAIGEYGYASLFLIMEEIIRFARTRGVPMSSRGSAASSLVAHCLGITSPDPMRLNLYFERFLNPARATPPDIDTDLCSRRREDVIDFVYKHFGAQRVAMVCTINRYRRRSALRDVAKAYELPASEIKALADRLPHRWWGPPGRVSDPDSPYAELLERYSSPVHQRIFADSTALLGIPRHLSIHPGGVVISPGPLTDLVPTLQATKGVTTTQFDLDSIERLGLIKIDLLGIRGLTVLGDVAEKLLEDRPEKYTSTGDVLENIPENDPLTAGLIQNGQTIGCFQIESPGMRATLREIQARSIDDIMIALALYRPGPLNGGLKDAFVRRHRRLEEPDFLHPTLSTLLSDTYGVILYQEQVLRIANELAGLDLVDADLLRRAMSHFDPGKHMITLKEKFIAGAAKKSGVPEATAERVWELMAAFAGYGFPKAHAASYAQVAWRIAWCKVHYPAIFMAAVLANWGGYYSQGTYLNEARRLGLVIKPPHINFSQAEFSLNYLENRPVLFMGLNQVRDLTRQTQTRIIRKRPFYSLLEFLARVDPRPVEVENLVRVGAFEGLGNIPSLLQQIGSRGWRGGQLPLFSPPPQEEEDWPAQKLIAAQEEILGASISVHPMELAASQVASLGALTTVEAAARLGQPVRVAGIRHAWRHSQSANGETVYFMSLEDLEGMLEVIISSRVYRRHRSAFSGPGPYIVEGTVQLNQTNGEPLIQAEKIWRLE